MRLSRRVRVSFTSPGAQLEGCAWKKIGGGSLGQGDVGSRRPARYKEDGTVLMGHIQLRFDEDEHMQQLLYVRGSIDHLNST
ncbi:hypothetical protein E1B28_007808 [Marasmius oreades]|uniref:Uncharacterized protein n=1 Tax=Marasmius oreades TaxID=181124 RepID=A0A9P7UVC3_9AGAR|nr:uncharacterized protein E1B28_007808 [Marasmius oreades]KAG7094201.1 hypothetical protein E1B28_007808 [Marasmius oreades]